MLDDFEQFLDVFERITQEVEMFAGLFGGRYLELDEPINPNNKYDYATEIFQGTQLTEDSNHWVYCGHEKVCYKTDLKIVK